MAPGSRRAGALRRAGGVPVGFTTGFCCTNGAGATDIFSKTAPLIIAIAMDTSQMSKIQLYMLCYSDSMGLVPYANTKCSRSTARQPLLRRHQLFLWYL
uniref:Uncharacterized protein n=1 Tax=Ixodes ricinus TaxID=34613 RepID=A0A147BBT2_IXORI